MEVKRNGSHPSDKGKPRQIRKCWLVIAFLITLGGSTASAQQLPSYIERPPDAAGVFAIYPGAGVPPGSEKWNWHEQTMQVPGFTGPNGMVRNVVIPTVTMFGRASSLDLHFCRYRRRKPPYKAPRNPRCLSTTRTITPETIAAGRVVCAET